MSWNMKNDVLKPSVEILAVLRTNVHLCKNALILRVDHGKGALKGNSKMLCLNGVPLLFYNAASCGTCAGYVGAGYGRENVDAKELECISDRMNADFVDLKTSVMGMVPLLGLLEDGYYVLADMDLFPTDGEGGYFWGDLDGVIRTFKRYHAYMSDGYMYDSSPAFLFASESGSRFDEQRVRYYMKQLMKEGETFPRAVAYYIGGCGNMLLDGHHKVAAAAALGEMARCIVIFNADLNEKALRWALSQGKEIHMDTTNGRTGEAIQRLMKNECGQITEFRLCINRTEEVIGELKGCIRQDIPLAQTDRKPGWEAALIPEEFTRFIGDYPDLDRFCDALRIAPNKIDAEYNKLVEQIKRIKPRDELYEKRIYYVWTYMDICRDARRDILEQMADIHRNFFL